MDWKRDIRVDVSIARMGNAVVVQFGFTCDNGAEARELADALAVSIEGRWDGQAPNRHPRTTETGVSMLDMMDLFNEIANKDV